MAMTEYIHNDDMLNEFEWDSIVDNFDASAVIWSTNKYRSYKDGVYIITWTEDVFQSHPSHWENCELIYDSSTLIFGFKEV